MRDIKQKIRRQTELLGVVLTANEKVTCAGLAYFFECEELTIKRDMQELRSDGIDIHSTAKDGVIIDGRILNEKLKDIVAAYVSACVTSSSYNRANSLIVNKLKEKSIVIISTLQRAVDSATKLEIEYKKPEESSYKLYIIEPMMIFESDSNWRILAREKGILKQFLLERIKSVKSTNESFRKIPKRELKQIFETSFKSWLGHDKYEIKIQLAQPWIQRLLSKQIMEHQKISRQNDGTVILETVVNSLDEIASWIVSRGEGIRVIEPEELKVRVIKLAEGALHNYS